MPDIESLLKEKRVFKPSKAFAKQANWSAKEVGEFRKLGANPQKFWAKMAKENVSWFTPWKKVLDWKPPFAKWFVGGKLNVSYNCLDRHVEGEGSWRRNKAAIIWEGEPGDTRVITYRRAPPRRLQVRQRAQEARCEEGRPRRALHADGARSSRSRCSPARASARRTRSSSAASRPTRCATASTTAGAKVVVTADGGFRKGLPFALKPTVDEACEQTPSVKKVVVVERTNTDVMMLRGRDEWWHELMEEASADCAPAKLDAEHPLFILYTSGTTGKPKGILHTTGGYLTHVATTHKAIFDLKEDDVYWCTADIGWITGHSYVVYGPLANGATTLMYEGVPTYPEADRWWDIIERWRALPEPAPAIAAAAASPPAAETEKVRATPRARAEAKRAGIDMATIAGSGPRGRVQGADVQALLDTLASPPSQPATSPPASFSEEVGALAVSRSGPQGGTPVVMIHGFASDSQSWSPIMGHLTDRPIIRIDLPCHGKSPRRSLASFADLAAELRRCFDGLQVEAAHLVGHSLGGALALALADTRPRKTASLTLMAPAGLGPEINGPALAGICAATRSASLGPWLKTLVADETIVTDSYVRLAMQARSDPQMRAAQTALADGLFPDGVQAFDLNAALARVQAPTRILWGKRDRIIPWRHALRAPGRVALHLFEDLGHLPQIEDAAAIGKLVDEWV